MGFSKMDIYTCVCILPILVEFRPDVIFIKNIIMSVLRHGVKYFREPIKAVNLFE